MKLSLALLSSTLALATAADFEAIRRRLSYEKIAGYTPGSQVTDHCAIDLDQAAIENQLALRTPESFEVARRIYEEGGFSKSYASIALNSGLASGIKTGDLIMGKNSDGNEVAGKAYEDYNQGDQSIKVQYATTDLQSSYVGCQVGGLNTEATNLKGCFANEGTLTIGGTEYVYKYDQTNDNNNGRTIAGFSTGAQDKMRMNCKGCPYTDFMYFYNYYGTDDYANDWVQAAFDGSSTSFRNGNADFSIYGLEGREQAVKKGTAYLAIFMYVIREMEDALDDCESNCINCNDGSVHAWDEGVCFYTGSIEGQDGASDDGVLLHQLADKRCQNFRTCGDMGTDLSGMSKLNFDLFTLFAEGNHQFTSGNCPAARDTMKRIVSKMYIPMIQGALRYAYKIEKLQGAETERAEGASFAAAVLPRVHAASADAAAIIYKSLGVGATDISAAAVKAAFESVYSDLGITCADVGGLWNEATKAYYEGMEPCVDSSVSSMSSSATTMSANVFAAAVTALAYLLIR